MSVTSPKCAVDGRGGGTSGGRSNSGGSRPDAHDCRTPSDSPARPRPTATDNRVLSTVGRSGFARPADRCGSCQRVHRTVPVDPQESVDLPICLLANRAFGLSHPRHASHSYVADDVTQTDDGGASGPCWDLAAQPAPCYEVDQRVSWQPSEAALRLAAGSLCV